MRALIYTLLCSVVLMLPLDAIAQTGAAGATGPGAAQQQPAPSDKALAVAPQSAPQSTPQAAQSASQSAGGPANICRELLAFLRSKAAAPQPPAAAGQPGSNQPGPNP